jgi:YHS domain-containing protein
MSLDAAVALAIVFSAASVGVGVYVTRYRAFVTEMLGMMIGMTMGMMSGIAVGFFVGAATDMFISNLVGVTVGLAFGAAFGRLGGLMGILDGSMGGFMGGMMGGMLGVMINVSPLAVQVTSVFTTVICLAVYAGLIMLVRRSAIKQWATDPVCDMLVDVATARLTSLYQGETVYFCAVGCKRAFDKNPERYRVSSPERHVADTPS